MPGPVMRDLPITDIPPAEVKVPKALDGLKRPVTDRRPAAHSAATTARPNKSDAVTRNRWPRHASPTHISTTVASRLRARFDDRGSTWLARHPARRKLRKAGLLSVRPAGRQVESSPIANPACAIARLVAGKNQPRSDLRVVALIGRTSGHASIFKQRDAPQRPRDA